MPHETGSNTKPCCRRGLNRNRNRNLRDEATPRHPKKPGKTQKRPMEKYDEAYEPSVVASTLTESVMSTLARHELETTDDERLDSMRFVRQQLRNSKPRDSANVFQEQPRSRRSHSSLHEALHR